MTGGEGGYLEIVTLSDMGGGGAQFHSQREQGCVVVAAVTDRVTVAAVTDMVIVAAIADTVTVMAITDDSIRVYFILYKSLDS